MAFHDEQREKEAPREADQSDTVSEHSDSQSEPFGQAAGACHQPAAQSDVCDRGQRMYQIHGQVACNPALYSGHRTHERPHPGRDQECTFANGETANVNWTLRLRYHTTPPASTNIGILERGTVRVTRSPARPLTWTMKQFQYPVQDTPRRSCWSGKSPWRVCQEGPHQLRLR